MALADVNKAVQDYDLLQRFTAAAAEKNIENPQQWIETNRYKLITHDVEGNTSIADLYAAAPPPPGINQDAIADSQILSAVQAIWDTLNP